MSKIVWTVVNKSKPDWKREYKVFSDENFIEFFESYFLGPESGPIEVTESMMHDFLRYIHKHEDYFLTKMNTMKWSHLRLQHCIRLNGIHGVFM